MRLAPRREMLRLALALPVTLSLATLPLACSRLKDGSLPGQVVDAAEAGDTQVDTHAAPPPGEGGSSEASDAHVDDRKDGARDAELDATPDGGCPPTSDFYVDPSPDAGACSFSTIAAALATSNASAAAVKAIHVAPGLYNAASGESFPVVLRDGTSLLGAGADISILEGTGSVPAVPPSNAYGPLSAAVTLAATLVVGDNSKSTTVSGFTLRPALSGQAGTYGIVCDRGNSSANRPQPNTFVEQVTVAGFEIGMRVTGSPSPLSGCNALVASSWFENGSYGVVADGLIDSRTLAVQQYVSVQLGDGPPARGNTFSGLSARGNGAGLATCDAVVGVVVLNNRFRQDSRESGDIGIWAVQQSAYDFPGYDIENNDFGPLINVGAALWGNVVVAKLVGNVFHDVSTQTIGWGWLGVGLELDGNRVPPPAFPVVRHARNNMFYANDIGLAFESANATVPVGTDLQDDFGTAKDPGANTFRCNAAPSLFQNAGGGGDVFVHVSTPQQPSLTIPFAGNTWDHAPPTMRSGSPTAVPFGLDLYSFAPSPDAGAYGPSLDVANPTAGTGYCPANRSPGP